MVQKADPLVPSNDPRLLEVQQRIQGGILTGHEPELIPFRRGEDAEFSLPERPTGEGGIATESLRKKIATNLTRIMHRFGLEDIPNLHAEFLEALSEFDTSTLLDFVRNALAPVPGWGYREGDPVVRQLSRVLMARLVRPDSQVLGIENLRDETNGPTVYLGNHLSAVDVHVFDTLLCRVGCEEAASRLTAVVGYKTFELPLLRQMSLCFGTLKVPQSASVKTGTLEMKERDIVRYAKKVLQISKERLAAGDHLVVFPEGTRSRTGEMLPCLAAVARYLRSTDLTIVPFGHTGSQNILPVADLKLKPAPVTLRIGTPIQAAELLDQFRGENRNARMMHFIGARIAELLPLDRRGYYSKSN